MTFSIVARCSSSGQLGVAISSSSIAVAARCPWLRPGVGAVATQNITLPALGARVLDQLAGGADAAVALDRACRTDPSIAYRQLAVIDHEGRTAHFTGSGALGVSTALAGNQCVAAGNLLRTPDVIPAMVRSFEASTGLLAERLLCALQAGLQAGGEAGDVHSAGLSVVADVEWRLVDLRVDWADEDPIGQLASLWRAYKPQMQDYLTRALDPTAAPSYGVPGDE